MSGNRSKDDPRFAKAKSDPRFGKISRSKAKLQIDSRFKALLTDEKFSSVHKVDKYGRPVQGKSREDMKKFYRLEDDGATKKSKKHIGEEAGEEEEEEEAPVVTVPEEKGDSEQEEQDEEQAEAENEEPEEEEEEEEEESDDSDDVEEAEEVVFEQEEAPPGEDSHRFAVQNLDWDRVRAVDLLVLLQSFCPSTGVVQSVTVYPSQFGLERMKRDALLGPPQEIWAEGEEKPRSAEDLVEDADSSSTGGASGKKKQSANGTGAQKGFSALKLRRYELEKLKYYYAVVVCDSVATAVAIYTQCDGLEFEQSANVLDLRFIPDDMTFDQQPRDTATEVPSTYVPPTFATRALGSTNVELTWDADDTGRIQLTSAALKGSAREDDLRAFLASDSEEDDAAVEQEDGQKVEAVRSKYKALLEEIKGQDEEQENIEITFVPGLSESAAQLLERKNEKTEELGPWEAHLQKKKEERKAKKKERKAAVQAQAEKEKQPQTREEREAAAAEEKRRTAELELLMLDTQGEDKKKGFKLDSMLTDDAKKSQKTSKKQRLKQKKEGTGEKKAVEATDFRVKVDDPRFAPLFDDSKFAIDPTSPHFKKTEGMKKILAEKRKRSRDREAADVAPEHEPVAKKTAPVSASLSSLVDSVKRKAATAPQEKKKK